MKHELNETIEDIGYGEHVPDRPIDPPEDIEEPEDDGEEQRQIETDSGQTWYDLMEIAEEQK